MVRYTYRKVTFYEPAAGNRLSVDHKRTEKGAVVQGVVVGTSELINDIPVGASVTLTRAEALEYIRDIAERIGGPGLADRLPKEFA